MPIRFRAVNIFKSKDLVSRESMTQDTTARGGRTDLGKGRYIWVRILYLQVADGLQWEASVSPGICPVLLGAAAAAAAA